MYTPTEDSAEELKTAVYGSSEEILARVPRNDHLIVMGNFIARVGKDVEARKVVIGRNERNLRKNKNC